MFIKIADLSFGFSIWQNKLDEYQVRRHDRPLSTFDDIAHAVHAAQGLIHLKSAR